MRTGIGLVVVIGIIAVIGNLLGGDDGKGGPDGKQETPKVAFRASSQGYTNAGSSLKPASPKRGDVTAEADEIRTMLDAWYQKAWVDAAEAETDDFDATYPDVAGLFAKEAQTNFKQDVDSLTLGKGKADIGRVEPSRAVARIGVYFEDRDKPTFAVVRVRFEAVGTPKREGARPVDIEQTGTYHMEKTGDGWRITFYESEQTQEERQPPSPTPTASS